MNKSLLLFGAALTILLSACASPMSSGPTTTRQPGSGTQASSDPIPNAAPGSHTPGDATSR